MKVLCVGGPLHGREEDFDPDHCYILKVKGFKKIRELTEQEISDRIEGVLDPSIPDPMIEIHTYRREHVILGDMTALPILVWEGIEP